MKRSFLDTPYGQVHFIVEGSDSGVPVVLLHQTPRSIDEFAEVIPLLAEKFRVIAIDRIGYGDSDKPKIQYAVEDYAKTVKLLLDHLGIEKTNIVGHHTGAIVGTEFAASYPDKVDKLVTSGLCYNDAEERKMMSDMQQWHVKADGSHLMEKWQKFSNWVSGPDIVHRVLVDLLKAGETSMYGHWAIGSYHMEDRIHLVKCPTLLIVGKKDHFAMREKNRIFPKILPRSEEVFVENGSIFLPTQLPETFAKLVMDFLNKKS